MKNAATLPENLSIICTPDPIDSLQANSIRYYMPPEHDIFDLLMKYDIVLFIIPPLCCSTV